jgi:sporulation protein YunB
MPLPRRVIIRRAKYAYAATAANRLGSLVLTVLLIGILTLTVKASLYLKTLAGEMALSDASDIIILAINDTVKRKMTEGQYEYDYFVSLEKDGQGNIAAISANMANINTFASQVLADVVDAADRGQLDIEIPLGNLLGMNLSLGRGPKIPVEIIMLTSSRTDFKNELTASGINQTKHQIILEVVVDVDILVPWDTLSTQVVSQVLIAETVIVGQVPETFVNVE